MSPAVHKKALTDMIHASSRRQSMHRVFSDFCELAAIAMSNAVDHAQRDVREARYMQIVGAYERDEVMRFARMLGELTNWLSCGFADCLGELFMSLELGNSAGGQFFTPFSVSSLMADLTLGNDVAGHIEKQGFITVSEPACGSGGMVLAVGDALQRRGINFQRSMHATAVDIDATAVHMAYVQLSLMHIPALVIQGNTLTLKEWGHWVTPAHVIGGWDFRLHRKRAKRELGDLVTSGAATTQQVATPHADQYARAAIETRVKQFALF